MQLLEDRFERNYQKLKRAVLSGIALAKSETSSSRLKPSSSDIELLETAIRSDQFRVEIASAMIDLFIGSFVCNILALAMHGFLITNYFMLWVVVIAFEAIPGLGGTPGIFRTIYLLISLTIPRSYKALLQYIRGVVDLQSTIQSIVKNILLSFSTSFDFGWVLIPFVRRENNLTLLRFFVWLNVRKLRTMLQRG